MEKNNEVGKKATHEELCDKALEHYEMLSTEGLQWLSIIPQAIKFYKKYGPEKHKEETIYIEKNEKDDDWDKSTSLHYEQDGDWGEPIIKHFQDW